jgi:hypothetical protein
MGPVSVDWVPTVNRGMPLDRPALVSHTMQRPRGPLSRRCLICQTFELFNSTMLSLMFGLSFVHWPLVPFHSRRQLFANAAIAAYLVLRRGLLVRPSHSAIADWMACRSASGIPADPLASASGQPWRLRERCFRRRRGFGVRAARNHFRQPGLAGRAAVLLDCVLRPAWLHWALQCPFVAEPGWCVQDVQKTLPLHLPKWGRSRPSSAT